MTIPSHPLPPEGYFPALGSSLSVLTRSWRAVLLAATGLFASTAGAQTIYVLTTDNKLLSAPTAAPTAATEVVTLNTTTVPAGETLVAIDVRPQNQKLYALGVDAAADTATLYLVSPETGILAPVGAASAIAFKALDGTTPIDLPVPADVTYDIDFNPAADRLRIVAGSLNLRVNPNTGTGVDSDGAPGNGTNPDGAIGSGTTTVDGTAYSNSQPNTSITTQYTLDGTSNSLFIQNPPNNGTQNLVAVVTLGGSTLDFETKAFDVPPGLNASVSGMTVTSGSGFALFNVGGTTSLYSINLVNAQTTLIGGSFANARSMAIRTELPVAVALSADGTTLLRFSPQTPGTPTTQAINTGNLAPDETLVGFDMRPATGQFYALGVDHDPGDDKGTLYLLDPQTGGLTAIGTPGQIAFVQADGATPVDLPDPATVGYGFDFNPAADRVRVTTSSGLNFRINQLTGAPVDGNLNSGTPPGTNTDGNISGTGITGIAATAYTNSFGGTTATTQYTLDNDTNSLYVQNAPNSGAQTLQLPVTLGGNPLDFTAVTGFDIPGSVRVSTSNATATGGEGYFVATVGGVTSLYQINLATGAAVQLGLVGATGATPLAGLFVTATPVLQVERTAGVTIYDGQETLDYGTLSAGLEATRTVIVSNDGPQSLTYSTSFNNGGVYSVTSNASGTIAAGASRTIEITFAPSAGPITEADVLHIVTNDVAMPSFEINLTGDTLPLLTEVDATVGAGDTRVNPLALSGLDDTFTITSVSDAAITISADGRTLIIPAGYGAAGFTYTATDGVTTRVGGVTVIGGTPVVAPTSFSGLLLTAGGDIIGTATAKISARGVATVQLTAGTSKASTKISVPAPGDSGANFTTLGYITLGRNTDTLDISLSALGGDIIGELVPVKTTVTATKYHIALGSVDPTFPGGGYAIATVSAKNVVKITGLLPDGVPFSAASALRDNDTFAFFTMTKGPKPPSTVGGELTTASLATTDVSGELRWVKRPQLPNVKGVHLDEDINTPLAATGCVYDGQTPLPDTANAVAGTLTLNGGNVPSETTAVVVKLGVPTPAVGSALKSWTGVKVKAGKFKATVMVPGITKPVKGSGIYLPKVNSAWGYFPGTTEGGSISLVVP